VRPLIPVLRALLTLVEVALVIALLAHPFWLVVRFPNVAPFVADLYETLVPWLLGMIILLVFRTPIETFLEGLAKAFTRLRSSGSANTAADFQQEGIELGGGEVVVADGTPWHIRYIAATIFGSQVAALFEMNDKGPRNREGLLQFYTDFLRQGGDKNYTFEHWLRYLLENIRAVHLNQEGVYEITPAGRKFVRDARGAGWAPENFRT
jgi:hypothetical protein